MSAFKTGLAALILVAGISQSAPAQVIVGGYGNRGIGSYNGFGYSSGYYGAYGNYGRYRGNYYNPYRYAYVPQTYNNMGGLMNAIRQQTGRPGSWQTYPNYGVSRGRRFR
jgi:hypothetical protein